MHSIEWRPEYSIGIDDVDQQHKHFLRLLRRAGEPAPTRDRRRLGELLGELESYAADNFRSEERLMRAARLPPGHVRLHVAAHSVFWRDLTRLEGRLKNGDAAIAPTLHSFMLFWLTDHVCRVDREMGRLLLASQRAAAGPGAASMGRWLT